MSAFLGIDTSNYTTSAAVYNKATNEIIQYKQLLPVKEGTLGLKQSDAVFSHVKQLPMIMEKLFALTDKPIKAVGYSLRPRDIEGSYMPCFLVGECVARSVASTLHIPALPFSHQAGHITAALYSVKRLDLINQKFIAFHFSGGTTDCLLVCPSKDNVFDIKQIGASLDLKAGQAVDRVGAMLGLGFPAGKQLEALALQSTAQYKVMPTMKGINCCISGLENNCLKMLEDGARKCDIARYCIDYIMAVVDKMTGIAIAEYGNLPLLYAGGVMSNSIIREYISKKHGGLFAKAEFSSDNAAGTAILAMLKMS